jgi:hypothetical protein
MEMTFTSTALVCAVESGRFEFAELLLEKGIRFGNEEELDISSIEMLQFALERGFQMNQKCYESLAERGKWKILDFLSRKGFNWNLEKCLVAAETKLQKGVVNWIKDRKISIQ